MRQAGTAAPDTKRTRSASSPRPRHVSARRSRGPRRPRTPGPASPPVLCGWPVPRAPGAERRASVRSCSQPRTGEKGAPRLSPRLLLLSRRSRRVAIADPPPPGHPDRPTREERKGTGTRAPYAQIFVPSFFTRCTGTRHACRQPTIRATATAAGAARQSRRAR